MHRDFLRGLAAAMGAFAFFAAARAAEVPLDEAHWVDVNPLGGVFANSTYDCRLANVQVFARAAGYAVASNAAISACFTPTAAGGTMWKTAAVALEQSPTRYWHLALVESPPPSNWRAFELCEMRDGVWQADRSLACETNVVRGAWRPGERYSLALRLSGGVAEGEVRSADGELVFLKRFRLSSGAVGCGAPVLKGARLQGVFSKVSVQSTQPVAGAARAKGRGRFWRVGSDPAGRAQFVSPDGRGTFLAGVGCVYAMGDFDLAARRHPYHDAVMRRYGSQEAWGDATAARLRDWGFNLLAFSDGDMLRRGFAYTEMLDFGAIASASGDEELSIVGGDEQPCTSMPNVFSPKFAEYCRFRARRLCLGRRDDENLVGYYLDNELAWWGKCADWHVGAAAGIFDAVAARPAGHSAKEALLEFLRGRGVSSPDAATPEMKRDFVRLVARRYFEITSSAIREADPNHLVLGCRFAGLTTADRVVWEECGRFCDVASANYYPIADLARGVVTDDERRTSPMAADMLRERARWSGRPLIVTEWSFSSLESPCPCVRGAGARFATQRERAEAASLFLRTMYALPCVAGHVWFRWCDQPPGGARGEGSENCNYGLVNADDEPYAALCDAFRAVQLSADFWRRQTLPAERGQDAGTPLERARSLVRGDPSRVEFRHDAQSGEFRAENGTLCIAGRVGGDFVRIGDRGLLSAMICTGGKVPRWPVAARVVAVSGAAADGLAVCEVTFASDTGRYRMVERYILPAGSDTVVAEHLAFCNDAPNAVKPPRVFFNLLPDAAPEEVESTFVKRPIMFYDPQPSAAWRFADGEELLAFAPRAAWVDVRLYKQDGALHGDIPYEMPQGVVIPGGGRYGFPERPFVFIRIQPRASR